MSERTYPEIRVESSQTFVKATIVLEKGWAEIFVIKEIDPDALAHGELKIKPVEIRIGLAHGDAHIMGHNMSIEQLEQHIEHENRAILLAQFFEYVFPCAESLTRHTLGDVERVSRAVHRIWGIEMSSPESETIK